MQEGVSYRALKNKQRGDRQISHRQASPGHFDTLHNRHRVCTDSTRPRSLFPADSWSDIDVAVFIEGLEHWDIRKRATALALVMEEAGSDVEAHLFPASALDHPLPAGFAEYVLRHGTRVLGPQ